MKDLTSKEKLLRIGTELMTSQGFASTPLDQLLKQSGVPKGSFYHYFGSKTGFGLAVIESYNEFFKHQLNKQFLNKDLSPIERLKAFVISAANGMKKYNFQRGCLIGNLGQEISALDKDFRQAIEAIFNQWAELTCELFEQGKQSEQVDRKVDSYQLAQAFWIGWEGAVLRAKLQQSPAPLYLFFNQFISSRTFLEEHPFDESDFN
jgi:TetR/AcrR family transcriptional repressor of nem operon